jgi:Mg-chelatase subunit ChlD
LAAVKLTPEQREELKKEREYVFLLDCSGSMDGGKTAQAIRTNLKKCPNIETGY